MSNFLFSPTVLIGEPGQVVTLGLQNISSPRHLQNFSIDEQAISVDVPDQETVTVTFPTEGAVTFYRKIHPDRQMRANCGSSEWPPARDPKRSSTPQAREDRSARGRLECLFELLVAS